MTIQSKNNVLVALVSGIGLALLSSGCASAPETSEDTGSSSAALSVDEEREAVRQACRGAYVNPGQCVACVAHQHTSVTSEFARGECADRCIKTSCAIEGKTCGVVDDGCGGSLSCGPPCGLTFAVTCTERIFGCTSPVGDVITTTTEDVVIKLSPTIVPAAPVPTGTVILSPAFSFIFGAYPGGGGRGLGGVEGTLEGVIYRPFGAAGYLEYASYSVDRTTMTFSSVSHRQSHGTCGGTAYQGGHKVCAGGLKP